jgi:hypothetical protein
MRAIAYEGCITTLAASRQEALKYRPSAASTPAARYSDRGVSSNHSRRDPR